MAVVYATSDMRRLPERRKEHTFWDHHHEIVRRLLLGQKAVDIAADLGITPQTVSNVRNNPLVAAQLESMHAERDKDAMTVADQIKEIAPRAVAVLKEAMDDNDSPWNAKVAAAKDILDRAGHAPVKRSENVNATLTLDELTAIKERARANGIVVPSAQPTEDTPFEEVKE